MRIERMLIENFKGISRLEIKAGGKDVEILGQNGTGKTTVADAFTWLLTGKMADNRLAEVGRFAGDGSLSVESNSVVEVEFDNGSVIRRESNGSAKFSINGEPMKLGEYNAEIHKLTNGAVGVLVMPQNFCRISWTERRQILMKLVGDIVSSEIIGRNGALEPIADLLSQYTPEQIITHSKDKLRRMTVDLNGIPARIDELTRQTKGVSDKGAVLAQINELTDKLKAQDAEVRRLQEISRTALNEHNKIRQTVREMESGVAKTENQIERNDNDLKNLRAEWTLLNEARSGRCPTCGSKVPSANLSQIKTRQREITERGRKLNEAQDVLRRGLTTAKAKLAELRPKCDADLSDNVNLTDALKARDDLQSAINSLKIQLAGIERAEAASERIAELRRQERELNAQVGEFERRIHLAGLFNQEKVKTIEAAINSKFQFVRFKMFEPFKTTEGYKECCEPMINGVPYDSHLSKGERLRAALDILRALQGYYGVELPIFIDDAESYTSNTFVDVPNQIIRLRAAEGVVELRIEAIERGRAV